MSGLPVFTSLRSYERPWLTLDLVAGLALWAVLVPEALAYATIAGVSPVIGLYAVPPALVLFAAFGSSRRLVVGPRSDQYSDVSRHPENETVPGIVILRVEGGIFFANADGVAAAIHAAAKEPGTRAVVLDAEAIPFIDISAINLLASTSHDLQKSDVTPAIAHDVGEVQDLIDHADRRTLIHHIYPTVQDAVTELTGSGSSTSA